MLAIAQMSTMLIMWYTEDEIMISFDDVFGLLIKGNRRDRVDLGTVDPYGVIAYPVEDDKGNLNLDRMAQQRVGRPHNIEAFRNINMSAPHFAPGMIASTGQQRDNTGILSVQRGNKTMAVANALPMRSPFFRVDANKQRQAWQGRPKPGGQVGNANRNAHMWTAGDLGQDELNSLFSGEKTPQEILGMGEQLKLGRNNFGDMMMGWQDEQGVIEAPRFSYSVYDMKDPSLPHKQKWKKENRIMRPDVSMPWRDATSGSVSGSVDPLLQIPLNSPWTDQSPTREGQRYVEYVDPRNNYRHEGIPVPRALAADYEKPGLSRGIATGTHGLYFDPRDLTSAGRELWDSGLSGDILQLSFDKIMEMVA